MIGRLSGGKKGDRFVEQQGLPFHKIVFVCVNQRDPGERVCCADGGGQVLRDKLKAMVKDRGLRGRIRVSQSGCMDRCEEGPNMMVFPDNVWFSAATEADLEPMLDAIVEDLRKEDALPRAYDKRMQEKP
jgi:(2Fe-2S) ferredoxin